MTLALMLFLVLVASFIAGCFYGLSNASKRVRTYYMVLIGGKPLYDKEGRLIMYQCSIDRKFAAKVGGLDRLGNLAPLEQITFTTVPEGAAKIVDTAPGECTCQPLIVGPFQFQARADTKIGPEGENFIVGLLDVEGLPGEAVTLTIIPGEQTPAE